MRKKFVKVMFFGALALSTVTYVGCKDYDDDIDNLQTQIDANKADIAKLQSFVKEGKWVTNVDPITGGFKITFNDGKSYEIVDGAKGDKGDAGAVGGQGTPGSKVTINKETGEWLIDGEPTGWFAKVQDGHSPYIANGTNGDKGYWYFWDSAANKFVKGDKAQGEQGTVGSNGKSPYIDEVTGKWVYYNEAGEKVYGPVAAGTNGDDAVSPFIGEDGYWYYWDIKQTAEDGTPGKLVKGDFAQTSVYVVKSKDRPAYDLHINVKNEDGTFTAKTLPLPSAEAIATMDIVSIEGGKISQDMTQAIELYYGVINKEIEFNGKKFGAKDKKTTLVGSNYNTLFALINPTSVDFSEYPVTLINSHGEEVFNVSQEKYMSTTPLNTRAADKWNVGVYALKVSLNPASVTEDLNGKTYAYALKAKDAFSNEIISKYDAKIIAKNEAKAFSAQNEEVDYTKAAALDQLFAGELTKVVDHYYTIEDNELKAIGATFDKATNTISAPTKQGSVNVKVNYLKTDGQKVEGANAVTCKVTFTYSIGTDIDVAEAAVWSLAKNASTTDMTLNKSSITITPENNADLFNLLNKDFAGSQATLQLAATDVKFAQAIEGITYAANSIKLAANQPEKLMKDGKVTGYKITFNFDPTTVCATVHNAVLKVMNPAPTPALGDNVLKKVNVKVEVKNPGIFEFKTLDAFFATSNTAVAYGTPVKNNNIVKQDLYDLFETISDADKALISFTEVRPNFGTAANPQYGATWLVDANTSTLQVPLEKAEKNDGVYSERKLTISYQPFGNTRLAKISKEFNLTVRSAIKQGSHPDIEAKNGKVLSIKDSEKSFTIAPSAFTVKDVYGTNVTIASASRDARVTNVTIELSSEIAKYAELKDQTGSPVAFGSELTVQLKATTVSIAREITGYALVKITDTWGAVTEVKCPITMKKD